MLDGALLHGVARYQVHLGVGVAADLPFQFERAKVAGDTNGLMSVSRDLLSGTTLAMEVGQVRIDRVSLRQHYTAKDGVARFVRGRLQIIERRLRLQGRDIRDRQIKTDEFRHLIRRVLLITTD